MLRQEREHDLDGTNGAITASGTDTKARELLTVLGLDPATQFGFFGFTTAFNVSGAGPPYTAIDTDIANTSQGGGETPSALI